MPLSGEPRVVYCYVNPQKVKDFENFFKKNPTPAAARAINQALEKMYSNIDWLGRDKDKIAEFLKNPTL